MRSERLIHFGLIDRFGMRRSVVVHHLSSHCARMHRIDSDTILGKCVSSMLCQKSKTTLARIV